MKKTKLQMLQQRKAVIEQQIREEEMRQKKQSMLAANRAKVKLGAVVIKILEDENPEQTINWAYFEDAENLRRFYRCLKQNGQKLTDAFPGLLDDPDLWEDETIPSEEGSFLESEPAPVPAGKPEPPRILFSESESPDPKIAFGTFRNIFLTREEHNDLVTKLGEDLCKKEIRAMSSYMKEHPSERFENHYETLLMDVQNKGIL